MNELLTVETFEFNPFRLNMKPPLIIADCRVWRITSPAWNRQAEHISIACAMRFNHGNPRGILFSGETHVHQPSGQSGWSRLKSDFFHASSVFDWSRLDEYLRKHPIHPFTWVPQRLRMVTYGNECSMDWLMLSALIAERRYDWVWIHETEGDEDDSGRDD